MLNMSNTYLRNHPPSFIKNSPTPRCLELFSLCQLQKRNNTSKYIKPTPKSKHFGDPSVGGPKIVDFQ